MVDTMTAYSITKAEEGTTIANNGVLNTIHFKTPPSIPGDWFTLVDDSSGSDRVLFNMQTSSMPFSSGTDIMTGGGIPFVNLTVRSISFGSQFDVDCS
jgi:hypothetical protein